MAPTVVIAVPHRAPHPEGARCGARCTRPYREPLRLAPPDAIVLIDASDSLRRGPARDLTWRGGTLADHITYIPGEDHYIALHAPHRRADLSIDNRDPAAPRLVHCSSPA